MKKNAEARWGRLYVVGTLGTVSLFCASCVSNGGGQIGGIGYDGQEKRILNEARIGGALVGAGAGALIANATDNNVAAGAALGGLGGLLVGNAVGTGQANKARAVRMDNDSLRQAIASARANNDRLAAYNRKVSQRIAEIKAKPADERQALARAELSSIDNAIEQTHRQTASRQEFVNSIPSDQAGQASAMNTEIRRGQSEVATLTSYRTELSRMGTVASN